VKSDKNPRVDNLNDRRAYILPQDPVPIVMFDDAQNLTGTEMKYLLQDALAPGSSQKLKRLVLFGEPSFMKTLEPLSATIAEETSLNKIYMPPLNIAEIGTYLRHQLTAAGYTGKNPFKPSVINFIHKASGGLPGRINAEAHKHLAGKGSHQNALLNIFRIDARIRKQNKVWISAAIAILSVAVLLLTVKYLSPIFRTKHRPLSVGQLQAIEKAEIKASLPIPLQQAYNKTVAIQKSAKDSLLPKTNSGPKSVLIIKSKKKAEQSPLKSKQRLKAKKQIYRENWLLAQNPTYFTIQILGVRSEKALLNFVESHLLRNPNPIAYFQTAYKGDDWYPLLFGIFSSQKNARKAVGELPEEIQKLSPWIRNVASVQKSIQKK
jgi:DamX protein